MSFSFSFLAADVEAAKAEVRRHMEPVLQQQPDHERDYPHVLATADTYLELVGNPAAGQVLNVNVAGAVGWYTDGNGEKVYTSASISVSAWHRGAP